MKKIISIVLLLALCLGLFAGCGDNEPAETTVASDLTSAKEYLTSMYQTAKKGEPIVLTADQDVLKSVAVAGVSYSVEWKVEITSGPADSVSVGESKKENHVKLDIPLHSGEDILFTATATITDPNGASDTVVFEYKVAGVQLAGDGMTMEQLVEAAYALEEDQALEGLAVLTGKVTMINTPYDEGYKNVTVTIQIGELTDKPIKCYRLKGDGAETLGIGDTITVSGTLKNYKGNVQFDAGCMIDELTKSTEPAPVAPTDPKEIIEAAYALEDNAALPYSSTLTGVITSIDTPYDEGFQNVTVTIAVTGCEDKPIKCYRLKGEGAAQLAVGDTITVTGSLMNYNGTVEFGQGCTLDAVTSGGGETPVAPTNPTDIVDAAYALEKDTALPYTATLTGTVFSVDDAYSADYQNITVTIQVQGRESKPIKCYRLKGEGADQIAKGDTITVTGIIKNYGGVIEFDAGCTLDSRVAGGNAPVVQETDPSKIMDAASKLKENEEMSYDVTLSGRVTAVNDAYDESYKNVTVTIAVSGTRSFLKCYRLKGEGVEKVAVGDTITATGRIKNFYGEIELTNCTMTARTSGGGSAVKVEKDPAKVMDAASKLKENEEMAYDATLSGRVTAVNDAYDKTYKNVTVTIAVSGTRSFLKCYRLKGEGVEKVAVGDTITVTGRLKNFYGEIELINCSMTERKSGGGTAPSQETDPGKIVDAAYALAKDTELAYDAELTGKVTAIDSPYDSVYQNISVIIAVSGRESKPILCYRLKGEGVDKICTGDTITVKGRLKNYGGKIEFVNCSMTKRVSGGGTVVQAPSDPKEIVNAAYALEKGTALPYRATLTGKITAVNTPYDANYKNVTVTIVVDGCEDKPIECFRLKGTGAENLKVGDTITVSGVLKRYYKEATEEKPELDKIEFDAGCTLG